MLIIAPPKFRKRREWKKAATVVPPVGPPVLMGANYDPTGLTLTLVFDRPIDVSGFDGSQVTVNDGTYNLNAYAGASPPTLTDAMTVVIGLNQVIWTEAGDVIMNATTVTGIVAVSDGSQWAGVADLVLPYP